MRCTRTRGKKGRPHPAPGDPPRRRANKRRGHGTFANDRPPVAGVVGRQTGEARLAVLRSASAAELEELVHDHTTTGAVLYTDEWSGYDGVDRPRQSCRHTPGAREWARDADGDGVREVHNNTCEGMWTGLRNYLRPFRGVSKWHLDGYVAVFQWAYKVKRVVGVFVQALFGLRPSTELGP